MASIRKRGDRQWEARIRRKGYPVTCKTFDTKFEAEAWSRDVESEMDKGIFTTRKEAESVTLKELLQRYLDEYVPALASPKREANRVKALQNRSLSMRIVATIRGQDITNFIRERQSEGVGGNTIRLDLAVLSRVFNLAISSWGLESIRNPVEKVSKPKVAKGRTRRLEEGEFESLLMHAPTPFKLILQFAVESAMRREEIASIEWKDVNFERRTVYLPKTKNSEERTVPLSPAALDILTEAKAIQKNSKVFAMSADAITQAMEQARKLATIENLHFHDLRHEATSRLFEHTDLDVMEIRAITGHRNLQMLARYSHLRTQRLANRLAGAKRGEADQAETSSHEKAPISPPKKDTHVTPKVKSSGG